MFANEYYNNEMEANDLEFEALVSNKKNNDMYGVPIYGYMTYCNVVIIDVGRRHENN